MITLHRSRVLVAAVTQPDGSVLVIDGGQELKLSAEDFKTRYIAASLDDVRSTLESTSGNGHRALPAPAVEVADIAPPVKKRRKLVGAPAKADARKSSKDWTLARKLWVDGVPTADIADRLGVSGSAVLWHANNDPWPQRKSKSGRKAAVRENPESAAITPPVAIAAVVPEPENAEEPAERMPPPAPRAATDRHLGLVLWNEGKDVVVIARDMRVPIATVELIKKQDKWPDRPAGVGTPARRCQSCDMMTSKDPCDKCGTRWNKSWKGD